MEEEGESTQGRSLTETPNWAVGTVITVLVILGYFSHGCLNQFGKWLKKTKRKSLLAALDKIKDELMLFGLLSLLMGHWIIFVSKICVPSSAMSSTFYPCVSRNEFRIVEHIMNYAVDREQMTTGRHDYCPQGKESFASYESLEQLHRFVFVLGMTHVYYSFVAIALAIIKIYSWRVWENQAKSMAIQSAQDSLQSEAGTRRMRRLSTFIFHHTSHPWSQHRLLVWLLCFSRQFWSSIGQADYMALRVGFITTHQLPLSYDFLNYMLRSMEEEFRNIVGISVPLWVYAIVCFFLDFHGSNAYFWLSFLPAILILLIGTKLHRVVVKLAVEIMGSSMRLGNHEFNLRDDLFWFEKPELLLKVIQFISFQNAYEMATFIWSMWEIKESTCFMENHAFVVTRLTFGYAPLSIAAVNVPATTNTVFLLSIVDGCRVISQFWCSFITFPLYVIVTQMGAKFKKSVLSESVRKSLHGWARQAKEKCSSSDTSLSKRSSTFSDSLTDKTKNRVGSSKRVEDDASTWHHETSIQKLQHDSCGASPYPYSGPRYDSFSDDEDDANNVYHENTHVKDDRHLLAPSF